MMTLNKIAPWGRKPILIKRIGDNTTPMLWADFDDPLHDAERLFDRLVSFSQGTYNGATQQEFNPLLDVHETDKEFQVSLEVPGMSENDIDISISKNMLTVSGEKKEEKEENAKDIYRVERLYGTFSRSIPLPDNCVDTDKAEASYKSGILTIKLPKTVGHRENVKKIPILASKTE